MSAVAVAEETLVISQPVKMDEASIKSAWDTFPRNPDGSKREPSMLRQALAAQGLHLPYMR